MDKADSEAARVLDRNLDTIHMRNEAVKDVAALLRARDAEIEAIKAEFIILEQASILETQECIKLRAEVERQKEFGREYIAKTDPLLSCAVDPEDGTCGKCRMCYWRELRDTLEKFPCGHRKVDWDDSYGDCVACKIKQQADDYDRLPLDVIECHDKIEELESSVSKLTAERDHWHSHYDAAQANWDQALAERDALMADNAMKDDLIKTAEALNESLRMAIGKRTAKPDKD